MMALMNMQDYMQKLQKREEADRNKWNELIEKTKSDATKNQILGGGARFADSISAMSPQLQNPTNYAGGYPNPKEAEVLEQNLAKTTKPDDKSGLYQLYLAQMKAAGKATKDAEAFANREKFKLNYEQNNTTKKLNDSIMAMQALKTSVSDQARDNPMGAGMAVRQLIVASGDPRPSDKDVKSFSSNPGIVNQIITVRDKLFKSQRLSDEDKDYVVELANIIYKKKLSQLAKHNDQWKKSGQTAYMLSPETASEIIKSSSIEDTESESEDTSKALNEQILSTLQGMVKK